MTKTKKRLVIILTAILLPFGLMTYQYGVGGSLNLRFISYPLNLINSLTAGLFQNVRDYLNVYEENQKLKEQIRTLMVERQIYAEVLQENKRLREIVDFKVHELKVIAIARVIGRGYDRALEILTIDRGLANGIKKGMAVITTKGLLGKIHRVYEDYADVLLLRDPNFSVSVRVQDNRVEGILSGTGYRYALLNYIPPEEKVEQGDMIVSSGLDGLFPAGIPIGVVDSVNRDKVEFFQYIKVIPFQQDSKADEVMVVVGRHR